MTLASHQLLLPIAFVAFALCGSLCANADDTTRRLLIDGEVVNAQTGAPVKSFRVIPGVRYVGAPGRRSSIAVWQAHMISEMADGKLQWPRTRGFDEMRFRIEAEGYRPATTNWVGKGGPHLRMKVHLRPDPGIAGILLTPDGDPAANATLAIAIPNRGIQISGCKIEGHGATPAGRLSDQWRRPQMVDTDANGRFTLPYETDPAAVLCVVHESGYFEQSYLEFAAGIGAEREEVTISLSRWCRIEGQVIWKDSPASGAELRASTIRAESYPGLIESSAVAFSEKDGSYVFDRLPPGFVRMAHQVMPPMVEIEHLNVAPKPAYLDKKIKTKRQSVFEYPVQFISTKHGQTEHVDFGGTGKTLVGQLSGLKSYQGVSISIQPPAPDVWGGRNAWNNNANLGNPRRGFNALRSATYAPHYFRDNIPVDKDGSFKIEDAMIGSYNLWVHGAAGAMAFTLETKHSSPHDLGTIAVRPK